MLRVLVILLGFLGALTNGCSGRPEPVRRVPLQSVLGDKSRPDAVDDRHSVQLAGKVVGATLSEPEKAVLSLVAQYSSSMVSDHTDQYLTDAGFEVPEERIWQQQSAVRKLAIATSLADSPQRFLARLASILSKAYPLDSDLQRWAQRDKPGALSFRTQQNPSDDFVVERSDIELHVIDRLAHFTQNRAAGTAEKIIHRSFKLPRLQTIRIVAMSASYEEALTRGLQELADADRAPAVLRAVGDLAKVYPSIAGNPVLGRLVDAQPPLMLDPFGRPTVRTAAPSEIVDRIRANGTALDPLMDLKHTAGNGITPSDLANVRPFSSFATGRPVIELQRATGATSGLTDDERDEAGASFAIIGRPPTNQLGIKIIPAPMPGSGATKPTTVAVDASRIPDGGMVYLAGGRLMLSKDMASLNGMVVDLCNKRTLCLVSKNAATASTKRPLLLPVELDDVGLEIWQRVIDQAIDAFYLSIEPTRSSLQKQAFNDFLLGHPTDKLYIDGSSKSYKVITEGNIQDAQLGMILFEADVLFKSAGLGFDVLRGKGKIPNNLPRAGRDEVRQLMDSTTTPSPPGTGTGQWCRYYWTSQGQRVVLEGSPGRLVVSGPPIIARAEAMVLRHGKLESFPKGDWCAGAKRIADSLNALVEKQGSKGIPPEIVNLRKAAQAQNVIKWIQEQEFPLTARLEEAVKRQLPKGKLVPRYTSGIASTPGVYVRLATGQTENYGEATVRVYAGGKDYARVKQDIPNLFKKHKQAARKKFRLAGYEFKNGSWLGPSSEFLKIHRSVASNFVYQYVNSLKATLLPHLTIRSIDEPVLSDGRKRVRTGYRLIPLPYSIHGGALLRAFGLSEPGEVSRLVLANGDLVFQRVGDALHFFAPDDLPRTPNMHVFSEHMRVAGVRVSEVYQDGPTIRFLLQATNGARRRSRESSRSTVVVNHNIRTDSAEIQRQLVIADTVTQQAVLLWAEPSGQASSRIISSPIADSELRSLGLLDRKTSSLSVHQIANGTILLEIRARRLEQHFNDQWDTILEQKNVARGIGHIRRLERAGFFETATERAGQVLAWLSEAQGADVYNAGKYMLLTRLLRDSVPSRQFRDVTPVEWADTQSDRKAIRTFRSVDRRVAKGMKIRVNDVTSLRTTLKRISQRVPLQWRWTVYDSSWKYLEGLQPQAQKSPVKRALQVLIDDTKRNAQALRVLVDGP